MDYCRKKRKKHNGDKAVSPVIGVMLMLVVVVIIAAVVSGFAGSFVENKEKAPTLTMDVTIKNTGFYATSIFKADVLSVTEPIATKDLKLITSWTASGSSGGAEVTSVANVFGWGGAGFPAEGVAPWGYGQGVKSVNTGKPGNTEQQFGNYVLVGGTTMYAYPAGQSGGFVTGNGTAGYGVVTSYEYSSWQYTAEDHVDGMQAVLGENWEDLRTGDVVNVKLVHIPSGMTIAEKNVVVG